MIFSTAPNVDYWTHHFDLTGTGETTVFTAPTASAAGDVGGSHVDILSISICPSDGVAGTATVKHGDGTTDWVLVRLGVVTGPIPLELGCLPLAMGSGHTIKVTGADNQMVSISGVRYVRDVNKPAR